MYNEARCKVGYLLLQLVSSCNQVDLRNEASSDGPNLADDLNDIWYDTSSVSLVLH